jgi:hypothetical protein
MREKKFTNGVSDQMNRPARRSAMIGMTMLFLQHATNTDAMKVIPNVAAINTLSALIGRVKFITMADASDTSSRMNPVLVKYSSASSPSWSLEKMEV